MFVGASRVVVAAVAAPSRRLPSLLAAAGEPEPIVSPLVGGLAYLGGWNDVNTFRRFGCYSNMMTGNSISFGWALGAMQWADTAFFLAVVSSYVLGVCSYRAAATWQPRRHRASRAAAAAVALAFVAADCLASCRWAVVPLALGSGIVNAVSSDEAGTVTCMVTGHLGKIANTLVDGLAGGLGAAPRGPQVRRRAGRLPLRRRLQRAAALVDLRRDTAVAFGGRVADARPLAAHVLGGRRELRGGAPARPG